MLKSRAGVSPAKSNDDWNKLRTVADVQTPLKPAAARIYQAIFPGSRVEDLREDGVKVHVLDQQFGIDSVLHTSSGTAVTIQEKYRDYPKWGFHDFTQEIKNGDGSLGEWSKLSAQFYFYGWGDPAKKVFLEWFILSIPQYKMIVEQLGGITEAGKVSRNDRDGSSLFVGVPFETVRPAVMFFGTGQVWLKRISSNSFSEPCAMSYPYKWTGVSAPGKCRLSASGHDCYHYPKDQSKLVCRNCGEFVEQSN